MDHLRKKTSEHIQWPEKRVLTSSKLLFFKTMSVKWDWVWKNKMKLYFFEDFWQSSFIISYLQKLPEFIVYILGCLLKLDKGLGLVCAAHFQHILLQKCFYNTSSVDQVSLWDLTNVSSIKEFVFLNSCLYSRWLHKLFIFNQLLL